MIVIVRTMLPTRENSHHIGRTDLKSGENTREGYPSKGSEWLVFTSIPPPQKMEALVFASVFPSKGAGTMAFIKTQVNTIVLKSSEHWHSLAFSPDLTSVPPIHGRNSFLHRREEKSLGTMGNRF